MPNTTIGEFANTVGIYEMTHNDITVTHRSMQYTANFNGDEKRRQFSNIIFLFLIFPQNMPCGYMLELSQRGGSNEYPHSMFYTKNKKNVYPFKTPDLVYKSGVPGFFSLNGHVRVMM